MSSLSAAQGGKSFQTSKELASLSASEALKGLTTAKLPRSELTPVAGDADGVMLDEAPPRMTRKMAETAADHENETIFVGLLDFGR